jgi:hypothetical protein
MTKNKEINGQETLTRLCKRKKESSIGIYPLEKIVPPIVILLI